MSTEQHSSHFLPRKYVAREADEREGGITDMLNFVVVHLVGKIDGLCGI